MKAVIAFRSSATLLAMTMAFVGCSQQGAPAASTADAATHAVAKMCIRDSAASAPSAYWTQRIGPEILTPSLRITGEQDLAAGMTLSYGASFTRQRNQEHWKPLPFDFNFMSEGASTFVSANNVHNHFGRDVLVGYSFAREFEGMRFSQEQAQSNLNFNLGLTGQLPWAKGWEFDVGYNDSSERGRSDQIASTVGLGEYGICLLYTSRCV